MMRLTWILSTLMMLFSSGSALAQIAPDTTLGSERSQFVPSNGTTPDRIQGGAIRGTNLFHSFSEFNINPGQRLYFANPSFVQNIFTRVTGGNTSTLSGVLGVEGAANLFLFNPNGVLFTQGAGLDLRGSLTVSTANAIRFGDRGQFSATNPQAPALLNVAPSALLYTQVGQGAITVRTRPFAGLELDQGQSLLLVGGNVLFENGGVFAPGGRLEVGGLSGIGEIGLSSDFQLSYPQNVRQADITLQARSRIDGGNGGQILLTGRNLLLDARDSGPDWAQIFVSSQTQPGSITLNAQDRIDIIGDRVIDTVTQGSVDAGKLSLNARSLSVREGGSFRALTLGSGRGADITINAIDSVEVFGTIAEGQAGFGSSTKGAGRTGDLTINTNRLSIRRGGVIANSALESTGDAGNLTVNADTVEVVGTELNTRPYFSILRTETFSQGNAGNLTINARRFSLRDGGLVSSRVFNGATGRGGALTVNASESVEVVGVSQNLPFINPSLLTAQTDSIGDAGTLRISTNRLSIRDSAEVSAQAIAKDANPVGAAGDLFVNANSVLLSNRSSLNVSSPTGSAGRLDITAQQILVDQSRLSAVTGLNQGTGAEISLRGLDTLVLRRGSQINASANNLAQGGNISIDATAIVAVPKENSDIRANAFQGRGGNVTINTQGLFGIEPAAAPIGQSDITASSELGVQGEISITQPDVQPAQGLLELPVDLIDASGQIAQVCRRGLIGRSVSRFVVSGRGSAPPNPIDSLSGTISTPLANLVDPSVNRSIAKTVPQPVPEIIEAQGWVKNSDGKIVLIAQSSETALPSIATCPH
ncbi:S-layer family protein [Leptolyngbya boryana FACHB-1624]|uniref:two-partner secretion domain-containing protein n=1 Tax=Leptolyngbya sp. FACHB-1624 TaxID=2692802 RepID=UPI001688F825|nr:filamentous hemagglutinin N-terminal domain-containing protein [Leptolyngbya sp. FACHB-1624]MBD1858021.1 S-layer family protein [Leptolyngbya sp. FACHB-1624]